MVSIALGVVLAISQNGVARAAGYEPQLNNMKPQLLGFQFEITNSESKYRFNCEITTAPLEDQILPWDQPRCAIENNKVVVVDLLKPSQQVAVKVTAFLNNVETGNSVLVGQALGIQSGLKPILGTPEVTQDGIQIPILNFDPSYTWAANNGFNQIIEPMYFAYWLGINDLNNVEFTTSKDGYAFGKTTLDLSSYKNLSPWFVDESAVGSIDLVVTSHTDLGFTVEISNYDDSLEYSCSLISGTDCIIDENGNAYVYTVSPGSFADVTIIASDSSGQTSSASILDNSIPKSHFKPTFGALVSTKDGFKSKIKNFNAELIYDLSTSAGKVTLLDDGYFVVTSLAKGQKATVTVATSCEDRDLGKATIQGKASSSIAPVTKKKN